MKTKTQIWVALNSLGVRVSKYVKDCVMRLLHLKVA